MHVPKVHIVSKWSSWLILVGMAIKSKQLKAFHTIGDSLSTPSFFLFSLGIGTGALEVFEHIESVNILVILNPTGYMWTSSGLAFIHLRSSL